jgi:hypothetical protein
MKTFPWQEREDYSISSWLNDLLNIIKQRGFILDKNSAMMIFLENSNEFLEDYCNGLSPMESFLDYEGEE